MGAAFLGPLCSGNILGETHLLFATVTAVLAFGVTIRICAREGYVFPASRARLVSHPA